MVVTHWLQSLCARFGWREVRRRSPRRRSRACRTLVFQGLETREVLSAVPDTLVVTVPDVAVEAYVLANDDDSGGPLDIVSVTQPDQGSVSIIEGDSDHLLYTPAAGFSGTESLTYTVEDSGGNQHTASVTITVGGSSAVPGGDPGLPGSVSYALQAGFNVDPAASFVATASGNYSLQDVRSTTTADTRLDNQGVTHTDVTTQSATLTIASTQAADGSWTYSEALASATSIATTGSDGSTASASGSYNYSFTASGDDTGSTYTFSANGTESVTTTYTEAWSTSDAGGSSTFTTTEISQFLVTVGNTTNADGTGSGSSSGSGSINRTYTGAGTYWYNFSTGSVSGVTAFGGFKNYSYSYATAATLDSSGWSTTGSRSDLESGSDTTSYVGSGTYSYVANGGTVSGTVTESGSDSGAALYATAATLAADGTWIESGTGSNGGSSTDNWSYAGAGTYSYQASGGTVSGTIVESGHDNHWSMHTTISTLPAGGVWSSTGGGGTGGGGGGSGGGSTADNWSYVGTGNYVSQSPGGTVTGTVFEDGYDNSAWTYTTLSTLAADGVWTTSGAGGGGGSTADNWSYIGSGSYSYEANGGTVSGTIAESGHDDSSSSYTTLSTMVAGVWISTGTDSESGNSADNWSYVGSGSYSYDTDGGTVSGTVSEDGYENSTSNYSTISTLAASGIWTTTGSGSGGGSSAENSSYVGSGSYSNEGYGGTVSGTINEDGHDDSFSTYTTISTLPAGGVWTMTGTGSGGGDSADNWSYIGSGLYSYQANGGTISGTIDEDGHDDSWSNYATTSTLAADGTWTTNTGTGGGGGSRADNWSYDGSGAYSYDTDGGTVSGIIKEDGHDDSSSSSTTTSIMVAGIWVTTGTGSESGDTVDNWSYIGSGLYSYESDNGTVSGTITEDGHNDSSSSYSTNSIMAANGVWTTTGTGSGTSDSADNWSYNGGGSYSYEGVSGTITEDGHDDSWASSSTSSLLAANGIWTTTGTGSTGGASADNWSYIGSGSYFYDTDGGTVSGTITEDGNDDSWSSYSSTSALTALGVWIPTGGGRSSGGDSASNWSYVGSGSYSYNGFAGPVSGTINEDGYDDTWSSYTTSTTMAADGSWPTTGTGSDGGDKADNWSYTGSGSYSYETTGGTVSGTFNEDGHNDTWSLYSKTSTQAADGTWSTTGTGSDGTDTADNWSYEGSGSYSYGSDGDTVSGTINEDGHDDSWSSYSTTSTLAADGVWTTTGTGSGGGDSAHNWSYEGSGAYSYDTVGGSVSGTTNEDGYDNTLDSYSTTSVLAGGVWTTTGTGSGGGDVAHNWSYLGSGSYSYETSGGSVSGTINEDGHDNDSSSYSTTSTLANGVWTSTGTSTGSFDIADNWSYEGSGSYSYETTGGSVSGTINEDGHENDSSTSTTNSTLADDVWTMTGTATDSGDSADNWSYVGSGSYAYDTTGGSVSGTIEEDGYENNSSSYSITSALADNVWTSTGTANGSGENAGNWSYIGSGTYAYETTGGTVSGTIDEDGHDDSSSSYSSTSTLANGVWTTTGTGNADGDIADNWSYAGSGSYSYDTLGGSVSGTITEDGHDDSSSSYSTTSTLANGVWTSTGTGADDVNAANNFSYTGSGSYSYDTNGGTVSGTITEDGFDNDSYILSTTSTLADGVWTDTGSSDETRDTANNWSYTGSGSYSYDTTGGTVSGSITEDGQDNDSSSYATTSTLADGAWTTTGTSTEDGDSESNWSYTGSGSYSYDTTGGSVSGSITEDGKDNASASYSWTSTLADGVWTTTGSQTEGADSSSNWSYEGSGTYSATDGATYAVSGSITESGNDNAASSHSTTSTLDADGDWTSTGNASESGDRAHDWSFSGSGTVSTSTSETSGDSSNGSSSSSSFNSSVNESGEEHDSDVFSTTSTMLNGVWTTTGGGTRTSDGQRTSTYSTNGSSSSSSNSSSSYSDENGSSSSSSSYSFNSNFSHTNNNNSSHQFSDVWAYAPDGAITSTTTQSNDTDSSVTYSHSATATSSSSYSSSGGGSSSSGSSYDTWTESYSGGYDDQTSSNSTVIVGASSSTSSSGSTHDRQSYGNATYHHSGNWSNSSSSSSADSSYSSSNSGYYSTDTTDNFDYTGSWSWSVAADGTQTDSSSSENNVDGTLDEISHSEWAWSSTSPEGSDSDSGETDYENHQSYSETVDYEGFYSGAYHAYGYYYGYGYYYYGYGYGYYYGGTVSDPGGPSRGGPGGHYVGSAPGAPWHGGPAKAGPPATFAASTEPSDPDEGSGSSGAGTASALIAPSESAPGEGPLHESGSPSALQPANAMASMANAAAMAPSGFGGTLKRIKGAVDDLIAGGKKLDPKVLGLGLDLAQMAIDIIGIFEPTPFADGINTAISLARRDWLGAGLSAVGMIPYIGDAAKLGKLGKYAKTVATAIELAKSSPEVAKALRPMIEALANVLNAVGDKIPQLSKIRKQLDDFLAAKTQPYGGPGGGHHAPAKSAFEGAPGYNPKTALAIPNAELKRLGIKHSTITGAQASLYRAFAKTGKKFTWEVMEQIETQALIKAGMSPEQAAATVRKMIEALKASGVSGPTRIPWGG